MNTQNKILKHILGVTIVAAAITGCSTPTASTGPSVFNNKVQVAESIERLELYTRPNGLELSARDEAAVNQFLRSYGHRGNGPLYINIPARTTAGLGAQQAQALIRRNLNSIGLGRASVQTGQYQVAHNSPAPVVVSYRTLKTVPQDCRQLGDVTDTYTNAPYDNFGCSHTANLAAMIDDPRQLIEPYDLTTPDSQRRQTVYDRYIGGENPASTQPDRQQISATN